MSTSLATIVAGTAATVATLGTSGIGWWVKNSAEKAFWNSQGQGSCQCPPCPQLDVFSAREAAEHVRQIDANTALASQRLLLVVFVILSYAGFFGIWCACGCARRDSSWSSGDKVRRPGRTQRAIEPAIVAIEEPRSKSVRAIKDYPARGRSRTRRHVVVDTSESEDGSSSADPVPW